MNWGASLLVALAVPLSGCAALHYQRTEIGNLSGRLIVEWREPDLFLYRPDSERPLTFVRKGGDAITPGEMLTDGGSIPRRFWALKNFSPWGYGPAFIVHDWLFQVHHCKWPGYEKYSLGEAATIMSEVMKTMMESPGFDYGNETVVYMMYEAVQTPRAREEWNNGTCLTPGVRAFAAPPDHVFVVEFPPRPTR
jgi:hypothetical protein